MWGAARQIAPDLSFKRWERKKKKITISSLINLPNQKVVVFFYLLRVPLFSVSVLASSKWTVHSSVCCETMRSATLAFIHRESHTQSCFLTHTCRGYERGYQYLQVNTFSSNTDISLCLAPPHSLPLCLSPVSLVRISVGVFIGCGAWVSLLADSNVTVSLMFL